jgi:DegV family protein with EDD domain
VFQEASSYAEGILVITLSSKLSMFYTSALLAKDILAEKMPHLKVEVVDSRTAAAAEGLIALAAARAAEEGKSLSEVVEVAERVKQKVRFIGLLETIRYVYRTGRIPKVASELGSVLAVKPLLVSGNGEIHFAGLARSRQNGIERMLKMMKDSLAGSRAVHCAVMHAACPGEAERLKEKVAKEFNCVELFVTDFSPVMGYATGKGTLAVAFYGED